MSYRPLISFGTLAFSLLIKKNGTLKQDRSYTFLFSPLISRLAIFCAISVQSRMVCKYIGKYTVYGDVGFILFGKKNFRPQTREET